jgi:Glycosyltransferases, probably involved in cell wall biogenesis
MTKFSVLMSVYFKENPENFDLSLKSNLQDQTLAPNEFVLVCDGELTPELEAVIDKYQKLYPEVLKVYRKENGGLGKALNYGLPKCSYPLVARSDSDDVCASNRFELQVKFMDEHPEVGIISSYIDEFDTDWNKPNKIKTLPLTHEELYDMAKFRNPLNHMSVMMRRNDIMRIGSYKHIPYVEDYELWVRAMINGIKIANVGEVLVHARVGNGMIQRRGTKKYIKSWHIMNRYMVDKGMIGNMTYLRNMMAITAFVFMPAGLKEFLYKKVLRKG